MTHPFEQFLVAVDQLPEMGVRAKQRKSLPIGLLQLLVLLLQTMHCLLCKSQPVAQCTTAMHRFVIVCLHQCQSFQNLR